MQFLLDTVMTLSNTPPIHGGDVGLELYMSARSLILLVEDNRDDAFFLRRAFLKAGLSHPIVDVRNGQQAVNYLSGNALYADRGLYPLPKLVVVDLKMPLMDGFELLSWLQNHPELSGLPTIVISSSDLAVDREKAMRLGARDYFVKPNDPEDLVKVVENLQAKWIGQGQSGAETLKV